MQVQTQLELTMGFYGNTRKRYLLLVPLRAVVQLVVEELHGLPPHRRQLISHQPLHHRDEGVCGQQGVHLERSQGVKGSSVHIRPPLQQ